MMQTLAQKVVNVTPPAAIVDNAAFTTASVDCKGFDWCDFYVILGATDIAMAALSLSESDDDSSYAAVTGANFATGTMPDGVAAALPSATQDNGIFHIGVDLRGRKRYLDIQATAGDGAAGTYACIIAVLSRAKEAPNTYAERGMTGEILV